MALDADCYAAVQQDIKARLLYALYTFLNFQKQRKHLVFVSS